MAILVYGAGTGTPVDGLKGVYVGLVLFGGGAARAVWTECFDNSHPAEAVMFLAAGVAFGYSGLSVFSVVPSVQYASLVGDVSLLVAVGLMIFCRHRSPSAA
ncbi:hypothetical protein ACH9L7_10330 [Haloferax sp. S1W]|uniref:hypothetical protein n=1 Tax=Haloferax sp. S1W TaxID=3377110 RepID=UPI0037CC94BF